MSTVDKIFENTLYTCYDDIFFNDKLKSALDFKT